MHRLSPYNITDTLTRAELYRMIREGQTADNDWRVYEIQPDEVLRPELTAYRVYGVDLSVLKPVVMIAAGVDDMRAELEPGITVKLPSAVWIRQMIRQLNRS